MLSLPPPDPLQLVSDSVSDEKKHVCLMQPVVVELGDVELDGWMVLTAQRECFRLAAYEALRQLASTAV